MIIPIPYSSLNAAGGLSCKAGAHRERRQQFGAAKDMAGVFMTERDIESENASKLQIRIALVVLLE